MVMLNWPLLSISLCVSVKPHFLKNCQHLFFLHTVPEVTLTRFIESDTKVIEGKPTITKITKVIETEPTFQKVVVEGGPSITKLTKVFEGEPSTMQITRVIEGKCPKSLPALKWFISKWRLTYQMFLSFQVQVMMRRENYLQVCFSETGEHGSGEGSLCFF